MLETSPEGDPGVARVRSKIFLGHSERKYVHGHVKRIEPQRRRHDVINFGIDGVGYGETTN